MERYERNTEIKYEAGSRKTKLQFTIALNFIFIDRHMHMHLGLDWYLCILEKHSTIELYCQSPRETSLETHPPILQ